jgi:Zn-finger nucleic acid-binding protein
MKQKTLMGVTIDYCEDSKGIWLDAGELEQIIEASKKDSSFFGNLFSGLFGK